ANLAGAAFAGGPQLASSLCFSPDSRYLALPGPGQTVSVVRADTGKELRRFQTPGGFAAITAIAFAPDGRTIAVAHGGQRVIGPVGAADGGAPLLSVWELSSG